MSMQRGFNPGFRTGFNPRTVPSPGWSRFAGSNPMFRSAPRGGSDQRFGPLAFSRPGGMAVMRGGGGFHGFGGGGHGGGHGR